MNKVHLTWDPCCDQRWRDYQHIKDTYLPANGLEVVEKIEEAEYALIITCAFSGDAQKRSMDLIKSCMKYLDERHIVILGCLPESAPHLLSGIKSLQLPPKKFDFLDEILIEAGLLRAVKLKFSNIRFKGLGYLDAADVGGQTWLLSLGEGCFLGSCAYCVKSKSCGKMHSIPIENIAENFIDGLEKGHRRFRFVGEDIAAYGMDAGLNFPKLLNYLLDIAAERKTTVYFNTFMNGANPEFLYRYLDELVEVYSRKDCFIDGMQLSVQSFNQRLLELCGRPGKAENWIKVIKRIKEIQPEMELWAQAIVCLPEETIDELRYEIETLCSLPVEVIHFYGYSHVKGNLFSENIKYDQVDYDSSFKLFLNLTEQYKLNIANRNGKSVIVTRFDKFEKNPRNSGYHKYRGI